MVITNAIGNISCCLSGKKLPLNIFSHSSFINQRRFKGIVSVFALTGFKIMNEILGSLRFYLLISRMHLVDPAASSTVSVSFQINGP